MQAGHLQQDQKDEFCTLARSVIQQAKEKVHKEMQASAAEPLTMLAEHSASERQEVEETFTAVDSSAALEQASDKDAVPCEPEQDPVVQREGNSSSSPVPQDHTSVVEHAAVRKEAVVSKEDKTFSKEEVLHREVGASSKDSTPVMEGESPPKEGKAPPKEGGTLPDDSVATSKEGGTPKVGGTPPKEGGTPPKEGRTPAKEGGTLAKDSGALDKEGGTPPKEGRTVPKEGGVPPKDVAHNFSVPLLSHESSTDSSAVSSPSEPVKTIGESTAEEVGGRGRWTMDSSDVWGGQA